MKISRELLARSVLAPVLVAVFLHTACVLYFVVRHNADTSTLLIVGTDRKEDPAFSAVTYHWKGAGYDGQFYYQLAQNPFRNHAEHLDHPVRHTRLLYPLVCWLFSFGDKSVLIYVLPLVNLCCTGLLTFLGAKYSCSRQQSPWWGLTLPFVLLLLTPTLRNLTDPIAILSLFGLLWNWERRHLGWITLCALACVFAREQNIAVVGIVGLCSLVAREWRISAALVMVGLAWASWVFVLKQMYGVWPFAPSTGNLASPGEGLQTWWNTPSHHATMWRIRVLYAVFMVGEVVLFAFHIVSQFRVRFLYVVGLFAAAMMLLAGPAVWEDWWSYSRNMYLLPLVLWMLNIQAGLRAGLAFGGISVVFAYASVKVM